MNMQRNLFIAATMALVLAVGIVVAITLQKIEFDKIVKQSQSTSESYDQQFVNLVNKLEDDLAVRARFGYTGGKDPMTGKRRTVAAVKIPAPARGAARTSAVANPASEDDVRLTAIIFDDRSMRYTAIVMVKERSLSVDVGDVVLDRTVRQIAAESVTMANATAEFRYSLSGDVLKRAL